MESLHVGCPGVRNPPGCHIANENDFRFSAFCHKYTIGFTSAIDREGAFDGKCTDSRQQTYYLGEIRPSVVLWLRSWARSAFFCSIESKAP